MKAIETRYRGHRFRSRLEARWAVFFDALGIEWEYEAEGYELSDGTRYLPDFWLPKHQVIVEIKGERPTNEEVRVLFALQAESGFSSVLLHGQPSADNGSLFQHCKICNSVNAIAIVLVINEQTRVWRQEWSPMGKWCNHKEGVRHHADALEDVVNAVVAARSARFEHGETPIIP